MAQYYLAQYYLAQNQPDQAQAIFNKLALQDSSWSLLAKDYI
jgi:predicted Zn-dependent protease